MIENNKSKWIIDPSHSSVEFSVKHLGIAWVKGRFTKFSVLAEFDSDNLEGGSVETKIEAESITTSDEKRDAHLKSPDFFDVENYPQAVFKSRSIKKTGGDEYKIEGELTIRGITKPVTLNGSYLGARLVPSLSGGEGQEKRAGFSAKTVINRHDFGVNWDMPSGEEVPIVGGEVEVSLNMEFIKPTS